MINIFLTQDLLLVNILKIVLFIVPEISLPKRRGRPFVYSLQIIVCCFLVMAAKRLSIRGLYKFLVMKHEKQAIAIRATIPFPQGKIPNRRTFDRRLKNSMLAIQLYMLSVTNVFRKKFRLGIARLSLDNRMFEAYGKIWHQNDLKKGIVPEKLRNIDKTAGWGISHYRGWVFGHALELFETTGRLVIPVLAMGRSLVERGNTAAKRIVSLLPKVKLGVIVADSEYFDQKLHQALKQTGRSLHAPSKQNPKQKVKSKTYSKRKITVEPAFERFLQAFVMRDRLDRKGPQAWPYLTTCCLLYQLVVLYNMLNHEQNPLQVTHLIHIL